MRFKSESEFRRWLGSQEAELRPSVNSWGPYFDGRVVTDGAVVEKQSGRVLGWYTTVRRGKLYYSVDVILRRKK